MFYIDNDGTFNYKSSDDEVVVVEQIYFPGSPTTTISYEIYYSGTVKGRYLLITDFLGDPYE